MTSRKIRVRERFSNLHTLRGRQRKKELHLYTQSNNDQDSTTLHAISAFLSDIATTCDGLFLESCDDGKIASCLLSVGRESNSLHFRY